MKCNSRTLDVDKCTAYFSPSSQNITPDKHRKLLKEQICALLTNSILHNLKFKNTGCIYHARFGGFEFKQKKTTFLVE